MHKNQTFCFGINYQFGLVCKVKTRIFGNSKSFNKRFRQVKGLLSTQLLSKASNRKSRI